MQLTWADQIEAKGVQKGLQRGIHTGLAKGRERGREEGLEKGLEQGLQVGADRLRSTVLRQLGQRFGTVPVTLRKRLAAIRSVEELGAIADRIFEVGSIEELGLGG